MNRWQECSLALLGLALMACSRKGGNAQQLENCTIVGGVANSAPSGSAVTQCLIMKYDWRGRDALAAGQVYQARIDSILQAMQEAASARQAAADREARERSAAERVARQTADSTQLVASIRPWVVCVRQVLKADTVVTKGEMDAVCGRRWPKAATAAHLRRWATYDRPRDLDALLPWARDEPESF